jgi:hypothetical protein
VRRGNQRLRVRSRQHDLLFSTDVLAAALLGHHARAGVGADGGVVPELRGDPNPDSRPSWISSDANACRRSYRRAPPMPTAAATGL